jgi:hypothetical protein
MKKAILLLPVLLTGLMLSFSSQNLQAQGNEGYRNGLRLYLNKDSTSFIRLLMWSQIWTRWQQQNPNTGINGNGNVAETWDIGIRRSRILLHGQLTPRLLVFWIIGANNQTFVNGGGGLLTGPDGVTDGKRQSVFVHDAWTEFKFSRELHVGAGLLTWSGLSRLSNAATLNFLNIDSPLYGWALLDANDQFARTLGIYFKGEIGKINYRAVLTKPFAIPEAATGWEGIPTGNAPAAGTTLSEADRRQALLAGVTPRGATSGRLPGWAAALISLPNAYNIANYNGRTNNQPLYQLYANYDFWDQESSVLPFMVGSYLGTKKVFNIGGGFMIQPQAMWSRQRRFLQALPAGIGAGLRQGQRDTLALDVINQGVFPTAARNYGALNTQDRTQLMRAAVDTARHDMRLFSIDSFLELPMGKGDRQSSITAYAAYYWFDFGPNYVRNAGTMNLGGANPLGVSNSQPATFNAAGTAYPTWGTGQVFHLQAGYLLPKRFTGNWGRLQPYGQVSYADFTRLNSWYFMPEAGLNWILAGQNAKITVHYRPRPIFSAASNTTPGQEQLGGMDRIGHRNEVITQFFIYF